jgi:hypothetical protein
MDSELLRGKYLLGCYKREGDPRRWPEFAPTEGDDWDMQATYSYCTWVVSADEQGIRAEAVWWPESRGLVLPFEPSFAPSHELARCALDPRADAARPLLRVNAVLEVEQGYLVAYDSGEFGGGLYWYDSMGELRQKLFGENVVRLSLTGEGVLAFSGLAHMLTDVGHATLLRFERESWRALHKLDVTGSPTAFLDESERSVVLATRNRIVRVSDARRVEVIHGTRFDFWGANSLVRDRDGTLYLGSKYIVVRLEPQAVGYAETWLAPTGVTRPRPGERSNEPAALRICVAGAQCTSLPPRRSRIQDE